MQPNGDDDLKKRQLIELAVFNGTYRDMTWPASISQPSSGGRKLGCCVSFSTSISLEHASED